MLKFKLMRFGKKREPHYRIVVTQAKNKRQGEYIEQVGSYNPLENPSVIKLENERIKYWLSKGVIPTETVHDMFAKKGLTESRKRVKVEKKVKKEVKTA